MCFAGSSSAENELIVLRVLYAVMYDPDKRSTMAEAEDQTYTSRVPCNKRFAIAVTGVS